MPRTLTTAADNALQSPNLAALFFVEFDFTSGFLRLNNSGVHITWASSLWYGVGRLGAIDAVQEGAELEARTVNFRITGIDPANISRAMGEHYQGRPVKMWLAPLDANHRVVADPVLCFHGLMDTMDIDLGQVASITASATSRLAAWDRAKVRRYNSEDQAIDYPADKGFEFVPQLVEKELRWGY